MPIYYVSGYEATRNMVYVEADSREEAIEKAWSGDAIEGTQDTEPGPSIWKGKWQAEEGEVSTGQHGLDRGLKTYRTKAR